MNAETRIEVQALLRRWPIDEAFRSRIVRKLVAIALDPESKARDANQAIKSLLAAEAQNQRDEHTAALQSDRNRFLEVAQQLGIDADFRLVGQEPADTSLGSVDGRIRDDATGVERYRAETDDAEQGG